MARPAMSPWPQRFRRSVTSEVVLGVVLLLSVSVFTSLPPARSVSSTSDLNAAADVDDLQIALDITPGRVGINTFAVNVTSNGQAIDNAKTVEARFTPANGSVAPSQAQLIGQGNGEYVIKGAYLSLPDTWQLASGVTITLTLTPTSHFRSALRPPRSICRGIA
jgi:hypothetical protein